MEEVTSEDEGFGFSLNEKNISTDHLCELLQVYLRDSNLHMICSLFRNNNVIESVKDMPFEVLVTTTKFITSNNAQCRSHIICCEKVLSILSDYCEPTELILYLVEQIEISNSELCFSLLLEPLKECLRKCNDLWKVFDICTDTIRGFLSTLPLPNSDIFQQSIYFNQINCIKPDDITKRIICIYQAIYAFTQSLLHDIRFNFKEIIQQNRHGLICDKSIQEAYQLKEYTLSLLFSMFGEPICFIQLECVEMVRIMTELMMLIKSVESNPMYWLTNSDSQNKKSTRLLENLDNQLGNFDKTYFHKSCSQSVSKLAISNWYWFVVCSSREYIFPLVYNLQYIFHICINQTIYFLNSSNAALIFKGLMMINVIIEQTNPHLISLEALDLPEHSQLLQHLIQIMIHCSRNENRRLAMNIFVKYVQQFTNTAKYLVVAKLLDTSNHSGVIGLVIGIVKNNIVQEMELDQESCDLFQGSNTFYGEKLKIIMLKINRLTCAYSSYLVEISDGVMSVLNLIRYLIIRDRNNKSGIWNIIPEIQENFLKPLKNIININKASWQIELDNLLLKQRPVSSTKYTKVTAARRDFGVPLEVNIEVCLQAITTVQVIESIWSRVNEILNKNSTTHEL